MDYNYFMDVFANLILPLIICSIILIISGVILYLAFLNNWTKLTGGMAGLGMVASIIAIIAFSVSFSNWKKKINERIYLDEYSYKGFLDKLDGSQKDYVRKFTSNSYELYVTLPYQDTLTNDDQLTFKLINSSNLLEGTLRNGSVGEKDAITSITSYSSDNGQTQSDLEYETRQILKDSASNFIIQGMQKFFYTEGKYKEKNDKTIDIRNFGIFPNYSDSMVTTYKNNYNVW